MLLTWSSHMFHMIFTQVSYEPHMCTTWPWQDDHMGFTCVSQDTHMMITWSLFGYHMILTWLSHDHIITWVPHDPHGYHVSTTWSTFWHHMIINGYHMFTTWSPYGYHTLITWAITWWWYPSSPHTMQEDWDTDLASGCYTPSRNHDAWHRCVANSALCWTACSSTARHWADGCLRSGRGVRQRAGSAARLLQSDCSAREHLWWRKDDKKEKRWFNNKHAD